MSSASGASNRCCVREGVRVLKVYLHTDVRDADSSRIAQLRADKLTRWRVTRRGSWLVRHHDRVARLARGCLTRDEQPEARVAS